MQDQPAGLPANTPPTPRTARPTRTLSIVLVLTATLAAVIANLAIFALASANGVSFDIGAPQSPSAASIAVFTAFPMAVGALVVALAMRYWPGAQRFAAWAGLAFAILTCGGSFGASQTLATALALSTMHVVTGAAWLYAVRPRAGS